VLEEKLKSASHAFRKQVPSRPERTKAAESDALNKELAELAEDPRKSKEFEKKIIYLEPRNIYARLGWKKIASGD